MADGTHEKREERKTQREVFIKKKNFPNSSETSRTTLLLHTEMQSPTHQLSQSYSTSSSFKLTGNLPFHLLPLAPLPSSPGSPSPSIYFSLFKASSSSFSLSLAPSENVALLWLKHTSNVLLPPFAAACHSHCLSNMFILHLCLSFTSLLSIFLPP